ncbi:MAG: creatininase family protein [Armatimonadota bacterium]|nr:creatininase family protein [Armatimonadota bacterium]
MKRISRREFIQDVGMAGLAAGAISSAAVSEAAAQPRGESVEVRYEMLKPAQMVARRKAFPVAYLPIGTLEWHDEHNPLGLDALKAHGIAVECARRGGGVVFPALFYGENRIEAQVDTQMADEYELPKENFGQYFTPFSVAEQAAAYQHLLIHILNQIASMGFRFIIVSAGHYPLLDHGRGAMSVFRQTARRCPHQPVTGWVFTGYELVGEQFARAGGDHAGPWETSIMMALDPKSVDLSLVSEGVRQSGAAKEFSADYGRKAVDAIVARVLERVNDMVKNPGKYLGHYTSM